MNTWVIFLVSFAIGIITGVAQDRNWIKKDSAFYPFLVLIWVISIAVSVISICCGILGK